jgi:hypothetical protein
VAQQPGAEGAKSEEAASFDLSAAGAAEKTDVRAHAHPGVMGSGMVGSQ